MFSRLEILGFWQKAQILPALKSTVKDNARIVANFYDIYNDVLAGTGVPSYVTGVIDMREESFNHHGYLGNGDPINKKTTHVPRGRGPFANWYEGAIDAFNVSGWSRLPSGGHWDIVTALIKLEAYNGEGYNHMGIRSPYVWAGTNMQQHGKYTSDGHFDANAWDTQLGCAAVLLSLRDDFGIDLNEA